MAESKDLPKILFYDIETAGIANALKCDLGFVIAFGYKWAHENKAHCLTVDKYDGLGKFEDKKLLQAASKLLNEADIVVTHFGSMFDLRFLQGRMAINQLDPINRASMRDTCFLARSIGTFSSNRLGHLAKVLNLKNQKLSKDSDSAAPWPLAWMKIMSGDAKALKGMAEYCMMDVLVLEELYNRLKVFDRNHPRIYTDRSKCPLCGSEIEYRGRAFVLNNQYRRFVCKNKTCMKWGRETNAIKG